MYHERRNKCPHCFTEFKHGEWSEDVEFTCRHCGNGFTLGEARRGRPDPTTIPNQFAEHVFALTNRVAALEAQLAEVKATVEKAR